MALLCGEEGKEYEGEGYKEKSTDTEGMRRGKGMTGFLSAWLHAYEHGDVHASIRGLRYEILEIVLSAAHIL